VYYRLCVVVNHAIFTHSQPPLQAKINNRSIAQSSCHHRAIYCIAVNAALRRRVLGLPKMIRDNKIVIRVDESHFGVHEYVVLREGGGEISAAISIKIMPSITPSSLPQPPPRKILQVALGRRQRGLYVKHLQPVGYRCRGVGAKTDNLKTFAS
jgi:hypothetical protein